jgi:hypothetical protein
MGERHRPDNPLRRSALDLANEYDRIADLLKQSEPPGQP